MSDRPPSLLDRTEERRRLAERLAVVPAVVVGVVVGLVVAVVLAVVVHVVVGILLGLVAGAGLAAAALVALRGQSTVAAVEVLGGRPADATEFPRLVNLVEGLAIATGDTAPELRVLDCGAANLAVAGAPGAAVMVLTTGLLATLDRVELEGVLAEGMARIRSHDAHLGAVAARRVAGPLLRATPGAAPGTAARRAERVRVLLGEQRDLLADLAAVDITRYPPALGSALEKLAATGTCVPGATLGTAHLWLVDPLPPVTEGAADPHRPFRMHQPIEHRVGLMAEL